MGRLELGSETEEGTTNFTNLTNEVSKAWVFEILVAEVGR
jgi:hypothetical protein